MSWYGPPQGPPPGQWAPPPQPPPQHYGEYYPPGGPPHHGHHHNGGYIQSYAPPGGPPPSWGGGGGGGGYPGQQYREEYGTQTAYNDYGQAYGGGGYNQQYAPPPGPPPMPPSQVQSYGPEFQQNGQAMHPYFQYSQCNGRKKALCIGINYYGTSNELKGCINDANNMRNFLCRQFGYNMDDIVLLSDDQSNPRAIPTRDNIIAAMQWLVRDAQPNDSLFFHYSGHGGQTKDLDGDEEDGYDEVIYPLDFETAGHIVDDDMFFIMVKPLPPGCRLTALFDSCHSGSVLDLPYLYSTEGKLKEPNLLAEAGQGLLQAGLSYARGDMGGLMQNAMSLFKTATGTSSRANQQARQTRTAPCDAISFAGCKDSQTSADTVEQGQATGAMSYAFIKSLSENPQQSYQGLLVSLRRILAAEYSQKPQLSSSHPIDTNLLFIA